MRTAKRSWIMGLLQVFFLLLVPVLLIITQVFLLVFTRNFKSTIYYMWTIADLVINANSIWSFIFQMQNLTVEHAQNMLTFEQLQ